MRAKSRQTNTLITLDPYSHVAFDLQQLAMGKVTAILFA